MKFIEDGLGDLKKTFGPEDVFRYCYAVLHAPTYRSRYAEFLKMDFARLPVTANRRLFRSLCRLGGTLVSFHLGEAQLPLITTFPVALEKGNPVREVRYAPEQRRVYINQDQYFQGLTSPVWNFHIGGYRICEKWLKDRKGRLLDSEDLQFYQYIVAALAETSAIMIDVDKAIERNGGWPLR